MPRLTRLEARPRWLMDRSPSDAWHSAADALRPVVLLVFANDYQPGSAGYLRNLRAEMMALQEALALGDELDAPYRVVIETFVDIDRLFDLFGRYNDRIVVFHYGGHARHDALMLEDDDGHPTAAFVEGLATRLGDLAHLALVFLNGCGTRPHVDAIRAACRAPVIATEQAIRDDIASRFAGRFYHDLAQGLTLGQCYRAAESEIRTVAARPAASRRPDADVEATRMLRPAGPSAPSWPWALHLHPEAPEASGWRLVAAARAPEPRPPPAPARQVWFVGPLAGLALAAVSIGGYFALRTDPPPATASIASVELAPPPPAAAEHAAPPPPVAAEHAAPSPLAPPDAAPSPAPAEDRAPPPAIAPRSAPAPEDPAAPSPDTAPRPPPDPPPRPHPNPPSNAQLLGRLDKQLADCQCRSAQATLEALRARRAARPEVLDGYQFRCKTSLPGACR